MPILRDRLSDAHIQRYWKVVEVTLREVFKMFDTGAMDDLKTSITQLPDDQAALFYHAEPLDVAAGLAGHGHEDLSPYRPDYEVVRKRLSWTP